MKNWKKDMVLKSYETKKAIERYENIMRLLGDEE
jgi:hypothetical protein